MSLSRNTAIVEQDARPQSPSVEALAGQGSMRLAETTSVRPSDAVDALVTHGWGRIAYNIVRSLGRKGLKVALGTDEFSGMAVLSRYTAAKFRHPSFVRQVPEFISSLTKAMRSFCPRVYLPSEQEVLVVSKYREHFRNLETRIPIAPFATLRVLHKKDALGRLAASLEVPTPQTIVPHSFADVLSFAREIGNPVVVKRLSSSSGRGVFFTTREALIKDGARALRGFSFGEFLVQKFVDGTGYGVSMLFNHGQLRARFTHVRLRERAPRGGVSTLRMSVQNPLLEEYAESILAQAGFHGVAMAEFKYNEEQKQAWLLEVNPRFWGSLALAIHAGVDFPYLLYRMALDGDIEPVLDYQKNVQGRWIMGDMFAKLSQRGRSARPRSGLTHIPTARVFDDFDWRDPLPFAGQFAFSAWKFIKTLNTRPEEADISPDRL